MKNFSATIQYDGTRYSGWQRQGNTDNTIESKISMVLTTMIDSDVPVEIHGSGRTDAGVHAFGQVANFHIDTDMTCENIREYMNRYLPEDINILDVKEVDTRFHARLNAKEKTYLYRIDNNKKADVFLRRFTHWSPDTYDIDKMKELIYVFLGQHDFRSFSDMKSNKKSTVRDIYSIRIFEHDGIIHIEYTGNGFLYHMVRKITAAFMEVGLGVKTIDDIKDILEKQDRQAFKSMAPAKGLALMKVMY